MTAQKTALLLFLTKVVPIIRIPKISIEYIRKKTRIGRTTSFEEMKKKLVTSSKSFTSNSKY